MDRPCITGRVPKQRREKRLFLQRSLSNRGFCGYASFLTLLRIMLFFIYDGVQVLVRKS